MSQFVMVKALHTLPSLSYLEESLSTHTSKHYNITGCSEDKDLVRNLSDNDYPIYFLVFSKKDAKQSIEYIYLATGKKVISADRIALKVSVLQKLSNQSMIDNFLFCSEIDLSQDFKLGSYVTLENSPSLVQQMNFIAYPPQSLDGASFKDYESISEECGLHLLAQKMSIVSENTRKVPEVRIKVNFKEIMNVLYIQRLLGEWWIKHKYFRLIRVTTIERG